MGPTGFLSILGLFSPCEDAVSLDGRGGGNDSTALRMQNSIVSIV